MSDTGRSQFVIALLTDLQRRRYSPAAWWRFFADSWQQSRATARAHPRLRRSWARIFILMGALTASGFLSIWLVEGQTAALRLLPVLLVCLALQQGDVYVHLGLNRHPSDSRFHERLGIPTTLTLARGAMAYLLLAHLLSGMIPPPGFTFCVYLLGVITDIADGPIARHTRWQTKLGGYLDGETDFWLASAATLSALLAGVLPAWCAALILLRFAIPLVSALFSYFVTIRQVDFTHTTWGRSAGVAQALLLLSVLAPLGLARLISPIALPLLLVTVAVMALALGVEIRSAFVLAREGASSRL